MWPWKKCGGDEIRSQCGNDTPSWKYMFSHMIFSLKLFICQDPRIARAYSAQNTNICALHACLPQPTYPIPARCGTDTAGRRALEPPLTRRRRWNEAIWPRISVPRIAYWGRDKMNCWPNPPQKGLSYTYLLFHNSILPCVEQPWNVRKKKSLVLGGAIVESVNTEIPAILTG